MFRAPCVTCRCTGCPLGKLLVQTARNGSVHLPLARAHQALSGSPGLKSFPHLSSPSLSPPPHPLSHTLPLSLPLSLSLSPSLSLSLFLSLSPPPLSLIPSLSGILPLFPLQVAVARTVYTMVKDSCLASLSFDSLSMRTRNRMVAFLCTLFGGPVVSDPRCNYSEPSSGRQLTGPAELYDHLARLKRRWACVGRVQECNDAMIVKFSPYLQLAP